MFEKLKNENKKELIIISFIVIYFLFSIIVDYNTGILEDGIFYKLFFSFNLIFLFTLLVFMTMFMKRIIKYLNSNKGNIYGLYALFFIIFFMGNMTVIPYVNTFGKQSEIIIQSPIIRIEGNGSIRKPFYAILNVDKNELYVEVRHRLKVGELYRITIYEGWMGIRYYKPNDGWDYHKNEIEYKHRIE